MIHVSGITKDYGPRRAIDSVSFDVNAGEIVAFLGPNGAGKTTTMRIITGYMPPTSGYVSIGGHDVFTDSMKARSLIGYLPETVPLYDDMTVFEYLSYMGKLRKVKYLDDAIDEVTELVHISDRSESYIRNLSKGLRQRVGLAQALLHHPQVLVLDEPSIGLDPAQMIDLRNLIREIGKKRTVLLSTHNLAEAQQVCDRVLIINRGKVVAEDTAGHLENLLLGSRQALLTTRENNHDLPRLLDGFHGLLDARILSINSIEIEYDQSLDIRPEIVQFLVEHKYHILELIPKRVSLEEIFLKLTSEEEEFLAGQ